MTAESWLLGQKTRLPPRVNLQLCKLKRLWRSAGNNANVLYIDFKNMIDCGVFTIKNLGSKNLKMDHSVLHLQCVCAYTRTYMSQMHTTTAHVAGEKTA